jgi:hypothetical protein
MLNIFELQKQTIWIRKLIWKPTLIQLNALEKFQEDVIGQPYSLKGLIKPKHKSNDITNDAYFCSELIGEAYRILGLLPNDSRIYLPGDFSSHSNLQLMNASLKNEVAVRFGKLELEYASTKQRRVK